MSYANLNRPHLWSADGIASVDFYNQWFLRFAPPTFRATRKRVTQTIEDMLTQTNDLRDITPAVLSAYPSALEALRMSTAPPLASDRLIGLAGVSPSLVKTMELGKLPKKMAKPLLDSELAKIGDLIELLADPDIFTWLKTGDSPSAEARLRASYIVADRLCGSNANPIIRNEQEKRQLAEIENWLTAKGYKKVGPPAYNYKTMPIGSFAFRMNVPGTKDNGTFVNIPIDVVVKPLSALPSDLPILIEAKSAGDFTNTNKRRKEEATKLVQLKKTLGPDVRFVLFLCGYFNNGYLGYAAADLMDWVWEHRINDLALLGL